MVLTQMSIVFGPNQYIRPLECALRRKDVKYIRSLVHHAKHGRLARHRLYSLISHRFPVVTTLYPSP